ncbi:unnamed protein product, partial [Mesorhabditis belari]|uniref:Protein-tyrosine phosphatase n=1 Tax=Mesorhabditis belari TaxID=2138241 RepID=A0AAF3EE16_9BILA
MCRGVNNKKGSTNEGDIIRRTGASDKEKEESPSRDQDPGPNTPSPPPTKTAQEGGGASASEKHKKDETGVIESRKDSKDDAVPGAEQQVHKWIQRTLDMGVPALRNEYRQLSKWCPEGMTYDAFKANQGAQPQRNRYQDVPCGDARRVVIKFPGAPCEYIHANFVKTPQAENRFICTQGPLENTVVDFWYMVIQEAVETIVMLCNFLETGKTKCHKYFPMEKDETMTITPDITVTNTKIGPMCPEEPSVKLSMLKVKFKKDGKEETRMIRHFHWQDWPDRGVPPCRLTSTELLSRIRDNQKPIVVHCSAGIGRTGTIVAIEHVLESLQYGKECVDMDKLLKELREQRPWSIQNDLQYLYIHRILLYYFLEKHKAKNQALLTPDNQAKYKQFSEEYEKATT